VRCDGGVTKHRANDSDFGTRGYELPGASCGGCMKRDKGLVLLGVALKNGMMGAGVDRAQDTEACGEEEAITAPG